MPTKEKIKQEIIKKRRRKFYAALSVHSHHRMNKGFRFFEA